MRRVELRSAATTPTATTASPRAPVLTRRQCLAAAPFAWGLSALATADDSPASPPASPPAVTPGLTPASQPVHFEKVTHEDLLELDQFRRAIDTYRDNAFQYEQKRGEYYELVAALHGATIEWPAVVAKVTTSEVVLDRCQFARTRIILSTLDQQGSPVYGAPRHPGYITTPSGATRYYILRAPTTLQVGGEVTEKFAAELREGSVLGLSGLIEHVATRLIHGNSPDTLVFVTGLTVAPKTLRSEDAYSGR